MEAIDFKKLLREERKRSKQKKQQNFQKPEKEWQSKKGKGESADKDHSDGNEGETVTQYDWDYPNGFLGFRELDLNSICKSPRTISYSSTALGKHSPEGAIAEGNKTGKIESEKISESYGTVDTKTPLSPEDALLDWLQKLPSGDSGLGEWKVMNYGKRRVCMFGEKGSLPPPLEEIAQELVKRDIFPQASCPRPNHVLLNEYQPGQGILAHTDGPRYEDRTATLSLGSDVVIEFTKRLRSNEIGTPSSMITVSEDNLDTENRSTSSIPIQIMLEKGSLLVFEGDAYANYCHGIGMDVLRDITSDNCLNAPSGKIIPRGLRYSLTFRHKKKES